MNDAPAQPRAELRFGLIAGIIAYGLWGLFPIYLKALLPTDALEVVAHRIVWSVPFGALVLSMRKQWRETVAAIMKPKIVLLLGLSSIFIAGNWLVYVWSVDHNHVLEASLGYYINPLIFIATGVIVLKERLSRLQTAAVIIAAIGVATLTVGAGVFPWQSFALAFLFTAYGFVRKTTPVGAMPGLFIETLLLSPVALFYLLWLAKTGALTFLHHSVALDILLVLAGPVTIGPLVLFALAARRLTLTTLGFLQYIGPTGQLFLGLYYGETFTHYHAICFGLIWVALALVSFDAAKNSAVLRKPISPAAVSATPKS